MSIENFLINNSSNHDFLLYVVVISIPISTIYIVQELFGFITTEYKNNAIL
jgi:hypothetical protein